MSDNINQTWIAEAMANALQSPYRGTGEHFASALVQNAACDEDHIREVAENMPELLDNFVRAFNAAPDNPLDHERMRTSMVVMDLMFIGALFHEYQDEFIAEGEPIDGEDVEQ